MTSGFLKTKDYIQFQILSIKGDVLVEFSGAKAAQKALPGDWVEWIESKQECKLISRTRHYPIIGVIELASKTKYGMTSRGVPIYLFIPFRKEYPLFVVGSSERNVSYNQIARINFDSWDTTTFPKGTLINLLGDVNSIQVQKDALLLTYNPFKNLKHVETNVLEKYTERDPCPELTFNIDPKGCRDIDDVISIKENVDSWEIWITIADVAELVLPGSEIDEYASLQAFTAYANGIAVKPMIPYTYSEDKCSLLPNTCRPGISLILTVDKQNLLILNLQWKLTSVYNKKQYEYDTFIEEANRDKIPVEIIQQVASHLLKKDTNDPHEWIEAFMLKYNIEAAKLLKKEDRGVLRKHDAPDLEKLADYSKIGGADLAVLANKSAKYCSTNDSSHVHYGLETDVYCHASSPIRRYSDLINQRVIKDILCNTSTVINSDIIWLNQRQYEMKCYERDLFFLEKITIQKSTSITAIVLDKKDGKLKLWIPEWKRLISWKRKTTDSINPGDTIKISYFANPNSRNWKDRIVFSSTL
jgi:exoribonuclease R